MRALPLLLFVLSTCFLMAASSSAQLLEFEQAPIRYHETAARDPVAQLQQRLDAGEVELAFDERFGYLPAVLQALEVSPSSQLLVFSKTSFQQRRITPRRPRAIYFDDDSYVGYVQFGEAVEISTTDPQLGGVFYTLRQVKTEQPRFVRDRGQCLTCHASSRTKGVPGHLVRSLSVDRSGYPLLGSGTQLADHALPFAERFGGWYVTGTHGVMRHMGNVQAPGGASGEQLDREQGANVTDLEGFLDTSRYLRPTSDLVALMVLEHQTQMHNYITLANMETRAALHYNTVMAEALDRPPDELSESTRRRIESVADKLVRYMLFSGEFALQSPVQGVSEFAAEFSRRGPRDSRGRSLYELDLQRRLLKYPCSWLIYSESFDQLPAPVYEVVARRLGEVLSGADQSEPFAHLTRDDRRSLREILRDTRPQLAKVWSRTGA